MRVIITLAWLLFSGTSFATIYSVGPSATYLSPNALYQANVLAAGDTIYIDGVDYLGGDALAAWAQNDLYIEGINGRPHLIADGQNIWGKGIWVLAGDNITVVNIEFSGASVPDRNGAGIRVDGSGFTISRCNFHDNENGILANPHPEAQVLIEYSEFYNNGFGDGQSHNVYINDAARLTFQFNYSHHAFIGHCLKSRASENVILYNRIMDEETGRSSRLVDLPNGGLSIIMGNLLMQGPSAENNNLIGYGLEGLTQGGTHEAYVINNTMINKRATALYFHINIDVNVFQVINNIVGGIGDVNLGPISLISNTIVEPDISVLQLVDEANYNYNLSSESPAIDQGMMLTIVDDVSLTPDLQYAHPRNAELRPANGSSIDLGAYEYDVISDDEIVLYDSGISIYPNPTIDDLHIEVVSGSYQLRIFSSTGAPLIEEVISDDFTIDLTFYQDGVYFLELINMDNALTSIQTILKY